MRTFIDRVVHPLSGFGYVPLVAIAASLSIAGSSLAQVAAAEDEPTMQQGQALIGQEDFEGAAEVFEAITIREPDNGQAWLLLGYSRHGAGDLAQALPAHLMAAEFPQPIGPIGMYNAACVYSLWERSDRAFQWLNRAIAAGFRNPDQLTGDPDMDNIREDDRFKKILARLRPPAPQPAASSGDGDSDASQISSMPAKRQFDFWTGTWNVQSTTGDTVGRNVIEKQLNGHLIHEHWTSSQGGQGKSLNFYNPDSKTWTQVWVDGSGGIIIKEGGFTEGAMRMEGKHILPNGEVRPIRSSLTPNADGTVRQYIQESTDGGETWTDWFEGKYVRVKAEAKSASADQKVDN